MTYLITDEMKTAMKLLASMGTQFFITREVKLPCGCWVLGGWKTETCEPNVSAIACSPEHKAAAQRAIDRWSTPESEIRFDGVEGYEAMRILLEEEIVNA